MKRVRTIPKTLQIASIFVFAIVVFGCKKNNPAPAPQSSFNFSIVNEVPPATVNFSNLSQNAASYDWDFGDNNTSKSLSPTHVYNQTGNYTVTLTARNASGATSVSQQTINVGAKSMTINTLTIDSAFEVSNPLYFVVTLQPNGGLLNTLSPYYLPYSNAEVLPAGYWNAINLTTSIQTPINIDVYFRFPNSDANNPEGSNGLSVFTLTPGNYINGNNAYPSTISLVNGAGIGETKLTFNVTWQ